MHTLSTPRAASFFQGRNSGSPGLFNFSQPNRPAASCRDRLAADPLRHRIVGTPFEDVNHCRAHGLAETLLDACGVQPDYTMQIHHHQTRPRDWHETGIRIFCRVLGPNIIAHASYAYQGPSLQPALHLIITSPACRLRDWTFPPLALAAPHKLLIDLHFNYT